MNQCGVLGRCLHHLTSSGNNGDPNNHMQMWDNVIASGEVAIINLEMALESATEVSMVENSLFYSSSESSRFSPPCLLGVTDALTR